MEANMEREDIKILVKKWWEIYDDESLDYKPEEARLQLLKAALSEFSNDYYMLAPSAA